MDELCNLLLYSFEEQCYFMELALAVLHKLSDNILL